ncbi:AMP-binding protein [Nonomuraea thailandensis]
MEALVERLVRVLGVVSADPRVRLSAVDVLEAQERRLVVEEWNDTAVGVLSGSLVGLFEAQVGRSPGAVAVVGADGERVSFGELDERANRVARLLVGRGVGVESVVGVCLERGVELVVVLLGVLKAGGAYVPVDPGFPVERVRMLLGDAGAGWLVGGAGGGLPEGVQWVDPVEAVGLSGGRLGEVCADGAAYVMFTSGSTGRPKGVVVSHAGVVNRLGWMQERLGLVAGEGCCRRRRSGSTCRCGSFSGRCCMGVCWCWRGRVVSGMRRIWRG